MTFLSVVTRCYKRPTMLARNIASLEAQTAPDYEQLFIVDDDGQGIGWANCQFYEHRDEPQGDYILMLDDDDMLARNDAVMLLRAAAASGPELIMHGFRYVEGIILPTEGVRENKWPTITQVGTSCFTTRRDIWYDNIEHFGIPTAGDYNFLYKTWPSLDSIEWLDEIIGEVQRVSHGAPE